MPVAQPIHRATARKNARALSTLRAPLAGYTDLGRNGS